MSETTPPPKKRGRPPGTATARAVPCTTCGAPAGAPCATGKDHVARRRAAGLQPYASGPSGAQRGHPERQAPMTEHTFGVVFLTPQRVPAKGRDVVHARARMIATMAERGLVLGVDYLIEASCA